MSTRYTFRRLSLLVVVMISLAASLVALACDTPVYRYALYRWQPTPYEVYYFHTEPAGKQDQEIRKTIDTVSGVNRGDTANIVYIPVNLNEDKELVGVPPDVKRAWTAKSGDVSAPAYMVTSPHGIELFTGSLDAKELSAVIDSPTRKKLGQQLELGKATVFLMLESGDEQADADADSVLKKIVADVAGGKLNLYGGPADQLPPSKEPKESGDPSKKDSKAVDKTKQEVGYLRVSRKDQAERWLVKQLMSVESDLGDFVDKPMVFAIYGRGRALPPFIGRGISSDNLIECVEFVTGACSCTVKEQNPGIDLLIRYDWEAASAKVAEKFGAEEGNEKQFGIDEFFPDLVIGGQGGIPDEFKAPKKSDEKPKPSDEKNNTKPDSDDSSDTEDSLETSGVDNALDTDANQVAKASPAKNKTVALASASTDSASPSRAESNVQSAQVRKVTVGVGLGIVILLLASMSAVLFKGN